MIICGIKFTHDGAIALIDGGKLVFSYESEKLDNNSRHSALTLAFSGIETILARHGYTLPMIDRFVIDGWGESWNLPEVEGKEFSIAVRLNGNAAVRIPVSGYGHLLENEDVLDVNTFGMRDTGLEYSSYRHISSHIFSAYCTSPFAKGKADSFVLVWDGVMAPQLFHYNPQSRKTRNFGSLFPLLGSIYTLFPHAYKPFSEEPLAPSIPGKAMAYVALGRSSPDVRRCLRRIFDEVIHDASHSSLSPLLVAIITKMFQTRAKEYSTKENIDPADMIASFHYFLQDMLVESIGKKIKTLDIPAGNLCFSGGSALNIKWNTALRDSGIFDEIWVPPFPNDSGSAIGAACCELVKRGEPEELSWSVYSGPPLGEVKILDPAWSMAPCTPKELAALLHQTGDPIVFLGDRAELGPRALGHRSILAAPTKSHTKKLLNEIKFREDYRPVAPVCMEEDAPAIFDPGCPDQYMLFEHTVRKNWAEKIPAVCHLDGTARLQTVTKTQNPDLYDLLSQYKQLSGIPLLCNTSANHKGKGFFPDIESAVDWGKVNHIWSNGCLYSRQLFT